MRLSLLAALLATAVSPLAQGAAPAPMQTAAATVPDRLALFFPEAPDFPGIRLLTFQRAADSSIRGSLTSDWYGTIPMQNPVVQGNRIAFDTRNLNDKDRPVRHWTITVSADGGALLDGGIWHADLHQQGRPATAAELAAHRFVPVALPPMGSLAPDGLAKTPPMGWSSWNKFAEKIDDQTVRAIADAMVATGLRDAGYRYVNIDDGWQGTRGADGRLRPNAKFPDMKALADYVHARGLKLGIYSSPGPRTCAGFEGSYGHVRQDAQTFAEWGVDYLKYDLCSGEWFYADADTVMRSYHEMGAALRETGRPILYSLCEYGRFDVGSWGRRVGGHLWRTTGDITDDYPTMARIGFDHNGKPGDAGPGGWNDPDMLEIGNGGMGEDAYRTHLTLWAMSAAPLMMGHDVRQTSPAALALLRNRALIALDQDPRGVQGAAIRREGNREVWRKPLADGSVALALFNRGDAPTVMPYGPADAGWQHFQAVRDLWTGKAVAKDQRAVTVPAQGVVLLKLRGR